MNLSTIIMAGGSGTRLWPLSRSQHPKQFINLINDESMLQNTVNRLSSLCVDSLITICNEEHRFFVASQLNEIGKLDKVILEPMQKNTAPAISAAVHCFEDDPIILVLAADHVISNKDAFTEAIKKAISIANDGKLVTFGIKPQSPKTGYGYIKTGSAFKDGFDIEKFTEKPTKQVAENYLKSGDYYWNSGMFMFKKSAYLNELEKYKKDIYENTLNSINNAVIEGEFIKINKEDFDKCENISIDYAVMEKTKNAVVVPMDADWSDIGSWSSLWEVLPKDKNGNVFRGDVIIENSQNCHIESEDRMITALGVSNLTIINTKDAILVADQNKVEDIKDVVEKLKVLNRSEAIIPREVHRPWGKYDSIDSDEGFQVKRITVNPGAKLSVQKHFHRAEHWTVVKGKAEVTIGDKTFIVNQNESVFIPKEEIHALKNPTKDIMQLIEVQCGDYLGEDDIVRFSDIYGRAES